MTTSTRVDGLLLVDKPAGVTSHDVVAAARRSLHESRIGHAGTLDPFATGLLVLLIGRATRLLPYLDAEPKEYTATVRFGQETDTLDSTGTTVRVAESPTAAAVDEAVAGLRGTIMQRPPSFSAKKLAGRRAYQAARRGEMLKLEPVRVTIHEFCILDRREAELNVRVVCSGGTYVRALARDLGMLSGSAAHLTALRRISAGGFSVRDACSLESLRAGGVAVRASLEAVASLPFERLRADEMERVCRGMPVEAREHGERAALIDASGALLAVAERQGTMWQPRVVLRDA